MKNTVETSIVLQAGGRSPRRWGRWISSVMAAAALAACGGGAGDQASPTRGAQASQALDANIVITTANADLATEGQFESITGYLAQSPSVLRGASDASARFTLRPPVVGRYEVFVWWPQNLADAGRVSIQIQHQDGENTVERDQRAGGGEWQSIGTYALDPSKPGSVTLRSASGAPLYVDAVRLQKTPESSAMSLGTDKLSVGLKDETYSAELRAAGGVPPYTYAIVDGELPPGLTLDTATGEITGRPARAGEFSVTVRSQDGKGSVSEQSFTLYIDESAGTASAALGLLPGKAGPDRRSLALGPTRAPDVSSMLTIVAGMAEGEWRRVNLNAFSAVWTPAALRPMYGLSNPTPSKIINAWSSFAWDPHRAALILYGGGHANYRGNDIYIWRASTQLWERGSLPSEMRQNVLGHWNAIDGVDKAPASAHTYDNTIFLPLLDRVLVLGGAADANGGHYLTMSASGTARITGPYLFDPARAGSDKVGGSTGSHVKRVAAYPEVMGGNMWSNRESWFNASALSAPPAESLSNGCTGYAEENGKDTVYLRTASRLLRYQINDLANPVADRWTAAGRYYYGGSGGQSACAYDPVRKIFLSPHSKTPLIYWNMANPGPANLDTLVTPVDPTGEFAALLASGALLMRSCGLEFDPVRSDFKMWCGDGRVWRITPPATMGAPGWVITRAPAPVHAVPTESVGTGILGKWKYIPNLDVFMGLADSVQGNVWVYKPHGWVNPAGGGNLPPSVMLTAPTNGATFTVGSAIVVSANAADGDGSLTQVEFVANGIKIGKTLVAPHGLVWNGATVGTHSLTAVATDDFGATKTSAAVTITVNPAVVPNVPPSVSLNSPVEGASVTSGTPITLEAAAADHDGIVVRVEFFAGGNKLGEATAAPFTWVWTLAPLGTSVLTAMATDDRGASTTSAAVSISVTPGAGGAGQVTLQRGTQPYAVADAYLSSYHKSLSFGATDNLQDQHSNYSSLLRFAIFQSEGGPVPNGARITSAVLSMYKYSSYNATFSVYRLLQDWSETTATWNQRLPGVSWATAGANGSGTDIAELAEASATTGFNPEWINFDVTVGVQQMSAAGSPANLGWRLKALSGYLSAVKKIYASEFAASPSLRPKLVIQYE